MKKIITVLVMVFAATLAACTNPKDDINKNTTESAVPPELNDSVAGKSESDKALEQLQGVVGDTARKN